ncbi:glucose-6-phosphate dehydrogenase [soil metagenome]
MTTTQPASTNLQERFQPAGNPLREGLRIERTPDPCAMVIFGASGDLTYRKLMPALYDLALERLLPAGFSVIGFAHRDMDAESFKAHLREGVERFSRFRPIDDAIWESFAEGISYVRGDFNNPEDYERLSAELTAVDTQRGSMGNRMYYLATPPEFYANIVSCLGAKHLTHREDGAWRRVIVEKPFGHDLESAQGLNKAVNEGFDERDVFRIDHYLGKETVQNILAFRFANGIYEPIWNRQYVDHVEITVAESIGIEGRGSYYDDTGALRDMAQNHMMQLLSLVAMEPPGSLHADAVRDEKVKVLHALRPINPDLVNRSAVRAQYADGFVSGKQVPGYREEDRVADGSLTETYVALKLFVDNWRWADVPFYLRTGKRLAKRVTEIAVHFKPVPHRLFSSQASQNLEPNLLVLEIQPDEGMALKFAVKVPGPTMRLRPVNMVFQYGTAFNTGSPDAYERLLLDAMLGDGTLFTRRDEVEAAWRTVTQILDGWSNLPDDQIPQFEAGTWGPMEADAFLNREGRSWRRP